jgi:pimeloyl-ACP methyl ester carboxylesterase
MYRKKSSNTQVTKDAKMQLHVQRSGAGEPLLILHGLFGSGTNWRTLSRAFAKHFDVWLLDARNHGRSTHADGMSYPDMAADVLALMNANGFERVHLMGHSMGGKTAMWTALSHPERVRTLTVADIAPVAYARELGPELVAMRGLNLSGLTRRAEADAALATAVSDRGVRTFLLQNLQVNADGARWRINLDAIAKAQSSLVGFPETDSVAPYAAPTLFVAGSESNYIQDSHWPTVRALFPAAKLTTLSGAGHWLHAEQPGPFAAAVQHHLRPAMAP